MTCSLDKITQNAGELPTSAVAQILGHSPANDSTFTGTMWQRPGLTQANFPKDIAGVSASNNVTCTENV